MKIQSKKELLASFSHNLSRLDNEMVGANKSISARTNVDRSRLQHRTHFSTWASQYTSCSHVD